jgi:hypothetical protein
MKLDSLPVSASGSKKIPCANKQGAGNVGNVLIVLTPRRAIAP